MKTKNPTNKELLNRIERLEKDIKTLTKWLSDISEAAYKGESAWRRQQPIGPRYRNIPASPEFPDFGKITVIDTEPEKALKDRVKEG